MNDIERERQKIVKNIVKARDTINRSEGILWGGSGGVSAAGRTAARRRWIKAVEDLKAFAEALEVFDANNIGS